MKYQIEDNVALDSLPPKAGAERRELTETMKKMSIGDSILVTDLKRVLVSNTASSFRIYADKHFQTRTTDKGIRIWRIK